MIELEGILNELKLANKLKAIEIRQKQNAGLTKYELYFLKKISERKE